MKKRFLKIFLTLVSIMLIISIYNYLDVHVIRKSTVQNYIDDSYLKPSYVAAFEKLKPKENIEPVMPIDSMLQEESLSEMISKSSVWLIGSRDVSMLREELHFKMFDYLKQKKSDDAEALFKKYLLIKNEEILSLRKLEENFTKINDTLLKKNKGIKNGDFYKSLHTQLKAKNQLVEKTQTAMQNRKIDLFGKELFLGLTIKNKEFLDGVGSRLINEFNFTESEVEEVDKDYLGNRILLMP